MVIAAKKKFWDIFFMMRLPFNSRPDEYARPWLIYLITDAPGMGCDEQDGVPVSMGKMQGQPLLQVLLTPQLPPQVAVPFACICNCCAETVPAHKTPMTSVAKKVDQVFFFMTISSYVSSLTATSPGPPLLPAA
jgi:hypothetical protein